MEYKHTPSEKTMRAVNQMDYWKSCVEAIDVAASRLGCSAIDLAEALQDGGIAELYESLAEMYRVCNISKDDAPHRVRARAILAKIRKEGE